MRRPVVRVGDDRRLRAGVSDPDDVGECDPHHSGAGSGRSDSGVEAGMNPEIPSGTLPGRAPRERARGSGR